MSADELQDQVLIGDFEFRPVARDARRSSSPIRWDCRGPGIAVRELKANRTQRHRDTEKFD